LAWSADSPDLDNGLAVTAAGALLVLALPAMAPSVLALSVPVLSVLALPAPIPSALAPSALAPSLLALSLLALPRVTAGEPPPLSEEAARLSMPMSSETVFLVSSMPVIRLKKISPMRPAMIASTRQVPATTRKAPHIPPGSPAERRPYAYANSSMMISGYATIRMNATNTAPKIARLRSTLNSLLARLIS
jgi:hypothetical protein